jgi:diguanylate cyclase (GGDEF)-like protein
VRRGLVLVRGEGPPPPPSATELDPPQTEAEATRRNGRIAGVLFIAGGIAGTPAIALHEPSFPPTVFLLTALAVVSGALCLRAPWERISPRWLLAVGAIASLEVFAVCMLIDPVFCWYYVLVAVYSAYAFPRSIDVAAQVGFAATLMFTAAAIEGAREIVYMLVAVPALVSVTVLVWTLRQQLERGRAGYRVLSRRDPLTGVGNYRELHDAIASQIARHTASQRRFSLVLVDLDDFKRINEAHGHLEGDRVLREVGSVLAADSRRDDIVTRHGGDEFAVVAPETSEEEAGELALRLEAAVSRLTVDGRTLRACSGFAVYPDHGKDSDALVRHADRAVRREKRQRRALPDPVEAPAYAGVASRN